MTQKLHLKEFQIQALNELKKLKTDLICIAPTGSGKGVIVEELAKNPKERILLISPLIALGRQQQHRLSAKNISSYCSMGINESPVGLEQSRVWILSPESALHPSKTNLILEWQPTLIVVDECHCIFEWGQDFRPAYGQLPSWIARLKAQRTLWMSATLPHAAILTIQAGLNRQLTVQGSFSLPPDLEIKFLQTPWSSRLRILSRILRERTEGGIVFTGSRQMTERIQNLIQAAGRKSFYYHAGLSSEERRIIEDKIQGASNSVVVATSAFGMGMDYQNLTWVLLWQPPRTVLSLAQALGRVGRNQKRGQALLLWDEVDFRWMNEEMIHLLNKDASDHPKKHLEKYFY